MEFFPQTFARQISEKLNLVQLQVLRQPFHGPHQWAGTRQSSLKGAFRTEVAKRRQQEINRFLFYETPHEQDSEHFTSRDRAGLEVIAVNAVGYHMLWYSRSIGLDVAAKICCYGHD